MHIYIYNIMHTTSYESTVHTLWPRNWPLRRLRPFSPFPTKGAAKSAPCAPRGVQGAGRLSKSYRNGSNITLWTTYSTKPSTTVTKSYKCPGSERNHTNVRVPNEIIQMSGFRTKSHKCPGSERNHTNVRVPNEIIQMSGFRTKSYKCPGSERNHTHVQVPIEIIQERLKHKLSGPPTAPSQAVQ